MSSLARVSLCVSPVRICKDKVDRVYLPIQLPLYLYIIDNDITTSNSSLSPKQMDMRVISDQLQSVLKKTNSNPNVFWVLISFQLFQLFN